ncbi:MAG: hypothetical protein M1817_004466 [Caeruleum heppii]|nr:MAG: hypothetical protein M1817_004466 [Caeruleum heppii]
MSLTFPSANTVLVFNVAGGAETSTTPGLGGAPTPATATKPTLALPAPGKPAEEGPEEKDKRIGQLLAEVDASAYKIADVPEGWDVSVPDESPAPTGPLVPPNCNTELSVPVNVHKHPNPLALQVGNNGEVPRWKPGSVIKWNYFTDGWQVSLLPPRSMEFAADASNLGREAPLKAKHYNAARTRLIAEAFFPNKNDLNYINVYSEGITSSWFTKLRSVFLHELGHVLGLRHEFAMDPGTMYEGGSVQFGPRDPYSVMNYRDEPPVITQKDIDGAKAFYGYTGAHIGSMPVKDYIPF